MWENKFPHNMALSYTFGREESWQREKREGRREGEEGREEKGEKGQEERGGRLGKTGKEGSKCFGMPLWYYQSEKKKVSNHLVSL